MSESKSLANSFMLDIWIPVSAELIRIDGTITWRPYYLDKTKLTSTAKIIGSKKIGDTINVDFLPFNVLPYAEELNKKSILYIYYEFADKECITKRYIRNIGVYTNPNEFNLGNFYSLRFILGTKYSQAYEKLGENSDLYLNEYATSGYPLIENPSSGREFYDYSSVHIQIESYEIYSTNPVDFKLMGFIVNSRVIDEDTKYGSIFGLADPLMGEINDIQETPKFRAWADQTQWNHYYSIHVNSEYNF